MTSKYFFAIIVSLFVLAALPLSVKAETCSDITMTSNPSSSVIGSSPKPIQIGIQRFVNPQNPWGDFKNATVAFPGSGVLNLSQSLVNLTALTTGSYVWDFNLTAAGIHQFSVNVKNSTSSCDLNLNYTSTLVTDPSLSASLTDLSELKANIDSAFDVILNNSGLGNAINLTIKVESNAFSTVEKSISNFTANTVNTTSFTLNPTQCLSTELKTYITYNNEAGDSFALSTLTDSFVVNGSDLVIDQFNLSESSVTEGSQVTFSVAVNNTGQKSAEGFNVTFYRSSVSAANKIAEIVNTETINLLEKKPVSVSWTTTGTGTSDVIAVAKSASGECNTANSQLSKSLTVNAQSRGGGPSGDGPSSPNSPSLPISPTPTTTPTPTPTPTPEPEKLQEVQQLGTLSTGETKIASFTKSEELNIQQISISVKNSVSGATVSVKKEKEKPSSVPEPSGEVHSFLTITTNVKNEDIGSSKVTFKLEKSWLTSKSIDKNKVSLNRFTSQWDKLSTTLLSEDDNFAYFVAETPGFSVFSITGEKISAQLPTPTPVTGGGGPSGLFLGGQGNLLVLAIIVIAGAVIFFLYKKKK